MMMDPATAYFLKKYYPHVIKWWLVTYNPEIVRIWPSKAEKDEALRLETEKKAAEEALRLETEKKAAEEEVDDSAFNATTGSYSGLYGKKPVDESTQAALDAILNASSNQSSVDSLLAGTTSGSQDLTSSLLTGAASDNCVILPPEQDEIIREANEIYERLLREAAEDEARKQAEIDEMRRQADLQFAQ